MLPGTFPKSDSQLDDPFVTEKYSCLVSWNAHAGRNLWKPLLEALLIPFTHGQKKLPEVLRTHSSIKHKDSQKTGIATFFECGYFKVDLTKQSLSRPDIFRPPLLCIHGGPEKGEKEKGEEERRGERRRRSKEEARISKHQSMRTFRSPSRHTHGCSFRTSRKLL
ncbi:uncharacterized protein LOC143435565 isoform X2 [Arvicanthis niloticus]|uniref:uncharacterized protein LOC143435565 isoform X2 n=1 Tax=Arvicanthis niloticus TaxID=61156 RepID=UPI00403CDEE6